MPAIKTLGLGSFLLFLFTSSLIMAYESPLPAAAASRPESKKELGDVLKERKVQLRSRSLEKESLLEAKKERVDFLLQKSRGLLAEGKQDEARRFARAALVLSPRNREALAALARARQAKESPKPQFDLFKEEVPHLSEAEKERMIRFFLRRGNLLAQRKLYDQAVEEYEKVFVLAPLHAQASRDIDAVKKKLIREKKEEWKKRSRGAGEDLNERMDVSLNTVKRLAKEGQYLEARMILNRAAFLDPSDKRVRRWMEKIRKLEQRAIRDQKP
ncbi:MAG: hypothetical protein HY714_00710 [Candidatus Omnitrophica bacterium]|nr:hypothetical protein [Candidatus Omnitrophota bacterium]